MYPWSGYLSLHQRSPLPTQEPRVLGSLRSKLCLFVSVKREICSKWASRNHAFTGRAAESMTDRAINLPLELAWSLSNSQSFLHTPKIFISYEPSNVFHYWPSCPRSAASHFLLFLLVTEAESIGEEDLKVWIIKNILKKEKKRKITSPLLALFFFCSGASSHANSLLNILDPCPPSSDLHSFLSPPLLPAISGLLLEF